MIDFISFHIKYNTFVTMEALYGTYANVLINIYCNQTFPGSQLLSSDPLDNGFDSARRMTHILRQYWPLHGE